MELIINKHPSLSEQKKTLRILLKTPKYSKNHKEMMKYVPMLKISIQGAEVRKKKSGRQKQKLELFPDEKKYIDYYGINHWEVGSDRYSVIEKPGIL